MALSVIVLHGLLDALYASMRTIVMIPSIIYGVTVIAGTMIVIIFAKRLVSLEMILGVRICCALYNAAQLNFLKEYFVMYFRDHTTYQEHLHMHIQ